MMAEKGFLRPFVIGSFAALVGLLAIPVGTSMTWATSHDQPRLMNKKPTMKAPMTPAAATSSPQGLTTQMPTTLDDYASYVQDIMQQEAMKVKTSGTADVKLTIGKDGSVQQTEVVRLEGPAALRNQITSIVSQMKLPPLPADVNADLLVVDTILAFNYPGIDLMDRFSRLPNSR
jgi:outer membrane biosynthesis protein TonB